MKTSNAIQRIAVAVLVAASLPACSNPFRKDPSPVQRAIAARAQGFSQSSDGRMMAAPSEKKPNNAAIFWTGRDEE